MQENIKYILKNINGVLQKAVWLTDKKIDKNGRKVTNPDFTNLVDLINRVENLIQEK